MTFRIDFISFHIKKLTICVFLLLQINYIAVCQDIHYTQYYNNPLYQNPSHTGLFDGSYRFILNQKTQWKAVTIPYRTFAFSFDTRALQQDEYLMGAGINFARDVAGDANLSTTIVSGNISFVKPINRKKNKLVSIGLQGGIFNQSIQSHLLVFEDQYNQHNPFSNNPTLEQLASQSNTQPDISGGILWQYNAKKYKTYNLGYCGSHFNIPMQSFQQNSAERLDFKHNFHGSMSINISPLWKCNPSFQISYQGRFLEPVYGVNVCYYPLPINQQSYSFGLGSYFRHGDAVISYLQLQYNQLILGISYDANISSLRKVSNFRGGFEYSLQYILGKMDVKQEIPCVIF